MSTTIDQKVVEMRFDNRQFESNVADSIASINKLRQNLDMKGMSKGLDNMSDSIGETRESFEQLEYASYKAGFQFSDVWHKMFSVAEWRMARHMVDNLEQGVKNLANSLLGITAAKTGFSEYETQINAIQTILANTESKGTTLDDVNGALDELNAYADKTIYNFTEMTRNIGTFTAAGVDLDTSVSAIKGIANLAAVSGSTSQQASTAMYQLSQAMASGTVKLMDWNSVVNAGMGGQVFQDALKETARVHGIAIDDIINKQGSFRESLSEGWLTTEILTDTLAKFTGDLSAEQLKAQGYTDEQIKGILKLGETANDAATKVKTFTQLFDTLKEAAQSGWTQTWEILVGDFEEAKELLTQVSDTIGGMINKYSEARNDLLENWKVLGGREDVIEGAKNIFQALLNVITPISEAFREIFPPLTAEKLVALTKGFKDFTEKLKMGDETADKFKRTFKGVFAVLSIAIKIIGAVFKILKPVLGIVDDLIRVILSVTAVLGDWLVGLNDVVEEMDLFGRIASSIARVLEFVINIVKKVAKFIADAFVVSPIAVMLSFIDGFRSKLDDTQTDTKNFGKTISSMFEALGDALENCALFKFLKALWGVLTTIASAIGKVVGTLIGGFVDRVANADFEGLLSIFSTISLGAIAAYLIKFIKSLTGIFDAVDDIKGKFTDLLDSFLGCFEAWQNNLKAEALFTVAKAILLIVAAIVVLTLVDPEKMKDAIAGFTVLFAELIAGLSILATASGGGFAAGRLAGVILGVGAAMLLLAFAVKTMSSLDPDELVAGLVGVAGTLGVLIGALAALSKIKSTNVMSTKGTGQLTKMAFMLLLIAIPLKMLGKMPWENIGRGLTAMGGTMAILSGTLFVLSKISSTKSMSTKGAGQLVKMAFALIVIAIPLKILGGMDWLTIGTGLGAMAGTLAILVATLAVMSLLNGKSMATKGANQMLKMAFVLIALAIPLKILGSMSWGAIGRGLTAMGGVLAIMVGVLTIMSLLSGSKNMVTKGANQMLKMALVLILLSVPLVTLSALNWGAIARGLTAMLGTLAILVGALTVVSMISSNKKMSTKGANQMLKMVLVLIAITIPLMALSMMNWQGIARSLTAIAGVFAIMVGALALMSLMKGSSTSGALAMLAMATAINMLVPSLIILSLVPIQGLIGGLIALAGAFVLLGLSALILAPLAPVIMTLAKSFALIGVGMLALGVGVIAFGAGLSVLAAGLVALAGAFVAISSMASTMAAVMAQLIAAVVEGIVRGLGAGLVALLDVVIEAAPKIYEAFKVLLLGLIDVCIECIPPLIDGLLKIVVMLLQALADYTPKIVELLFEILIRVLDGIATYIGPLIEAAVNVFLAFLNGLIQAIAGLDTSYIADMLLTTSMLLAVMGELALMAALTGPAMIGVLGMAAVVTELGLLLAALGGLAQIPGLNWLIGEGSKLMSSIGSAIGQFIGNIVGGVMEGVSAHLAQVGTDLSNFMTNIQPFIEGARNIDQSVVDGIMNLVKVVIAITAASFLEGITSWLTGGSSIADFGAELVLLGQGLKGYSDAVSGINIESVNAATEAAKALVEMSNNVPNRGGLEMLFTGENSLALFGAELVLFGEGLKGFADAVSGIDIEATKAAAEASKSLVEMSNQVPNRGGLEMLFTGENSLALFGDELAAFGYGLKGFSDAVSGINPEEVTAAANAAKSLAEMSACVPNRGGLESFITGENSLALFSTELIALGVGLAGFALAVDGITPEKVTAAAEAAKSLAEMSEHIPNKDGIAQWFTGQSSVALFGNELEDLGKGLAKFAFATKDITPESLSAASCAAKDLALMTSYIPNKDGIAQWFTGQSSVAAFSDELGLLGTGLANFALNFGDTSPEKLQGAAQAAKSLAEMTKNVPSANGIAQWFTGESSIAKFGDQLPGLGEDLAGFGNKFGNTDPEKITAAANAAKTLANMTQIVPGNMEDVVNFGNNLETFGRRLYTYYNVLKPVTQENIDTATNALKSVKNFSSLDTGAVKAAATALNALIDSMTRMAGVKSSYADGFKAAVEKLGETSMDSFVKAFDKLDSDMADVGKTAVNAFVKAIDAQKTDMETSGKESVGKFMEGAEDKSKSVTTTFEKVANKGIEGLRNKYQGFYDAGAYLVSGFAAGISANTYKAEAKAKAMAEAAERAAKEALDEHSPSRVFYKIGDFAGKGFVNALDSYGTTSYDAGSEMANSAKKGLSDAINKIRSFIEGDIDAQPTIRPVLDLSDIKSGAGAISSLFGANPSVGVLTNVSAIGSMMNARNQNGGTEEVVSAINKLRKDLGNVGNTTYNVNGVTYDDGSNITDAVRTLTRAVIVGRRM